MEGSGASWATTSMLGLKAFMAQVADLLQLPTTSQVLPDSSLEGLGLDSLDQVLLQSMVEDLADAPPGVAGGTTFPTVGHAFAAYRELHDPGDRGGDREILPDALGEAPTEGPSAGHGRWPT